MQIQKKSVIKEMQGMMGREINELVKLPLEEDNSLTGKTSLGAPPISKLRIFFKDAEVCDVIVKSKSSKVILNGIKLLNFEKSGNLFYHLLRYHRILSFDHSFLREISFYNHIEKDLRSSLPHVYGTYQNRLKDRYLIVMREFCKVEVSGKELAYRVLDSILPFHLAYYGKKESVARLKLNCYSLKDYERSRFLLRTLFEGFGDENRLYFQENLSYLMIFIENIHIRKGALGEHFTLTHNDLSPRNLYFDGNGVILYDWELAAYQNPEHDLIEYLCFVLHDFSDSEVFELMTYYKENLFEALNLTMSDGQYQKILEFNAAEFIVNKLSVYRRAGKTFPLDFIDDLCRNAARLLWLIRARKQNGVS